MWSVEKTEIDTLIIGSGAGGLSAAICLARAGQKVVVLEQHDVPGGWCHSFYLQGQRFSPGVHYIGLLEKGESTSRLYEGLGVANDLVFFRMNPKAYEHCVIGNERFDLPANFEGLKSMLSSRFPNEKKKIHNYLNTVRKVSTELQSLSKMSGFWDNVLVPWRTRHMGKYGLFTLKRVIDWHIKDPLLKKVLNVQCGDHGLAPATASFPLHCAVMDHYFNGGFYPMGGGGALVKAMTTAIKNQGGEIRTGRGVKRILLSEGKPKTAIGVELENGEKLYAKRVVSNADPTKTYRDLVGEDNLSAKLKKKLDKTSYSCASLILFLTVDMDVKAAGLDSGNVWMMANRDMDELYVDMMQKDILTGEVFEGLFVSCTTLKDPPSFNGRHHTLEVVTFINYDSFLAYKNEGKTRSEAYLNYKEELMEKMVRTLELIVPGITSKIVQKHLGTPITNEYYINSSNGSVYGTEKKLKQIGPFAFGKKSEIANLYLCGASILSHGVAGAGYSGVETAAAILGCKPAELLINDGSQAVRIYEAEDDTAYPDWIQQKIKLKRAGLQRDEKRFADHASTRLRRADKKN